MTRSVQAIPEAPPGVDPAVLAKINAMFAKTTQRTSMAEQVVVASPQGLKEETASMTVDEGAWFGSSHKKVKPVRKGMIVLNHEYSDEGELPSPQEASYKVQEVVDDVDDADAHNTPETHPLLPKYEQDDNPANSSAVTPSSQLTDPTEPRILTRTVYRSKRKTAKTTHKGPIAAPSLSTLLLAIFTYLSNIIFEYSPYQIRETSKKLVVRVEAQEIEFTSLTSSKTTSTQPNYSSSSSDTATAEPGSMVGVIVLLHVGDDRNGQQGRIVEIRAKPKRVRQLLQDEGVENLVEDMYGMELRGALMKLGRKMSRKKMV
jgi:hypothetical protein